MQDGIATAVTLTAGPGTAVALLRGEDYATLLIRTADATIEIVLTDRKLADAIEKTAYAAWMHLLRVQELCDDAQHGGVGTVSR